MKTLIKPLFVALSFAFATVVASPADANPIGRPAAVATYKSAIYTTAAGKLNIALDKQTGGSVDIRLKNADGTVLFSQHLGKNDQKYRTRLNLNELPDGQYQLEMTNGLETTHQTITLSTPKVAAPERVILTEVAINN